MHILRHVYRSGAQPELAPPAILLRESYREHGRVRKRTLCNLSDWPAAHIEGLHGVLKGGTVIPVEHEAFTVIRSLPHGHVAAVLGTARKIGLHRILGPEGNRCHDLVLALIVSRILDPTSKLAAARALSPATAASSLGNLLGLGEIDEDELYTALDWLLERQPAIETALAKRHLANGTLVLYDVSSSYMEGRCCPLAKRGYSRDGRRGILQIVYGLLCAPDGCPVAIEVFDGNTADPKTLSAQIGKLKPRFHLDHVVLVGDRGMITQARSTEDIRTAGLDWITALRGPAIKALLQSSALQLSLFDDTDKDAAEALRTSVVAKAQRSPAAFTKQTTGLTKEGLPVHSFRSLLADLATMARNTIVTAITPNYSITVLTRPTPIQNKALELLGVSM
ncbi:IS1634 family transposase [Lichenicoccus sp.]|uniref:IS1634 family transposase n=1 Tax=Lichenicoccus sp. TaxID=2781899 RepID=UPI003D0C0C24